MPTYQYACKACDHRFEAVQSFSDSALTECPECTGTLRKVFSSVGIVFKGSGFYRTDSRSGAGQGESNGNGKEGSTSSESSSSGDKSSADKKPAAAGASSGTSSGASSGTSSSTSSSSTTATAAAS